MASQERSKAAGILTSNGAHCLSNKSRYLRAHSRERQGEGITGGGERVRGRKEGRRGARERYQELIQCSFRIGSGPHARAARSGLGGVGGEWG
eukprot:2242013-Rhodomonas_salina.2